LEITFSPTIPKNAFIRGNPTISNYEVNRHLSIAQQNTFSPQSEQTKPIHKTNQIFVYWVNVKKRQFTELIIADTDAREEFHKL